MPDTNPDRAIGRLEGRIDGLDDKLDAIQQLIKEQSEVSSRSRSVLYDRVGAIETDIKISAGLDAQVRQRLDDLDGKITNEVMPTINEVKRWKIAGMTIIGMAGIAGVSIGAFFMWAWEVIVERWQGGP